MQLFKNKTKQGSWIKTLSPVQGVVASYLFLLWVGAEEFSVYSVNWLSAVTAAVGVITANGFAQLVKNIGRNVAYLLQLTVIVFVNQQHIYHNCLKYFLRTDLYTDKYNNCSNFMWGNCLIQHNQVSPTWLSCSNLMHIRICIYTTCVVFTKLIRSWNIYNAH